MTQRLRLQEHKNGEVGDNCQEKIFCWQQKVFSKEEEKFYKNESNCLSDLEKKLHTEVLSLPETQNDLLDLFCYTNDDDFSISKMADDEDQGHVNVMFIMADLGLI